ncbi:MAG: hypothetical protein R3336_02135 [Phycisphaeraceae bacterium]|nr:hypothetical protein [Phycisphaeraceae bacterium]
MGFSDLYDGGFQIRLGRRRPWIPATRDRMIRETSAFLTRALRRRRMPRIPTRRLDQGGFTEILRHRGARAAANHFWRRMMRLASLD